MHQTFNIYLKSKTLMILLQQTGCDMPKICIKIRDNMLHVASLHFVLIAIINHISAHACIGKSSVVTRRGVDLFPCFEWKVSPLETLLSTMYIPGTCFCSVWRSFFLLLLYLKRIQSHGTSIDAYRSKKQIFKKLSFSICPFLTLEKINWILCGSRLIHMTNIREFRIVSCLMGPLHSLYI